MKLRHLKKQSGAILAFSLVMLLLLTLAGTRMIQQNKQQLQMAGNTRLLTQAFADAEGVLEDAKDIVLTDPSHQDPTSSPTQPIEINAKEHQCTPIPVLYRQQLLLAGKLLIDRTMPDNRSAKAQIVGTWCADTSGIPTQKCTSYDETTQKLTCHLDSGNVDCTGKTIEAVASLFSIGDDCYQHYDPTCADDNYLGNSCSPKPPKCPVEVYAIRAISQSANGTTREIISSKQVKCGTP